MLCRECGSTQFEEENGLMFCCFCQTQSQGFTQESEGVFLNLTKSQEVKKKVKKVVQQKKEVLWTTTEAFNHILWNQMKVILEITSEITDLDEMCELSKLVWLSYLRKAGLALTDNESGDSQVISRRLHPASRFRDVQILSNKVENCLPPYRNGSSDTGFSQFFNLGTEVIRTYDKLENCRKIEFKMTEKEEEYESLDIIHDRYRDPRKYVHIVSNGMKISKESRKQLQEILLKVIEKSTENFDNLDENEENVLKIMESIEEEIRDSESKASITSDDSIGTSGDFDKRIIKNLTEATKLLSKYIPLWYLKKSSNINSNYFIDLMSLPKTLSIMNIICRLLGYDIYCFDWIRWANEKHILYNNCVTCFPSDWPLISNDFHTFTSSCVPSLKTISILSAKIANHINISSFSRPNLEKLFIRFIKDLNLPKDMVYIITSNYNLFDHFHKQLDKMAKCRANQQMPYYEVWTLMAIVLVLKRIFILNDSTEKRLSHSLENADNLFIWDEWESYTRDRLDLIRSYFIPSYPGDMEDIKDVDLISEHFLQRTEDLPSFGANKKAIYKHSDFRNEVQQEFKEFAYNESKTQTPVLEPSLYPLTNATNFALNRINSSALNEKMAISFEDKVMEPWICNHGSAFHRGYQFLSSDPNKWSDSFKLVIYLSRFILNCRLQILTPILRSMEKTYFGKKYD